jgi:hypothetical protein
VGQGPWLAGVASEAQIERELTAGQWGPRRTWQPGIATQGA